MNPNRLSWSPAAANGERIALWGGYVFRCTRLAPRVYMLRIQLFDETILLRSCDCEEAVMMRGEIWAKAEQEAIDEVKRLLIEQETQAPLEEVCEENVPAGKFPYTLEAYRNGNRLINAGANTVERLLLKAIVWMPGDSSYRRAYAIPARILDRTGNVVMDYKALDEALAAKQ